MKTLHDEMTKKINRSINQKVYPKVFKGIIVSLLGFLGVILLIHGIFTISNYNPNKEAAFLNQGNVSEYDVLYTTYYQMTHPGMLYITSNNNDTLTSKGFGCYQTTGRIQSSFEPVHLGPQTNAVVDIKQSTSTLKSNEGYFLLDEFKDPQRTDFNFTHSYQTLLDEIKKLPETTYLDLSLSFKDYQSLDTIAAMISNDDIHAAYIALKDQSPLTTMGTSGGLTLNQTIAWDFNETAKQNYPDFILFNEKVTSEQLKNSYLSHLKLLIDHPQFVGTIDELSMTRLKDNYKKAQEELLAYGLRIHITARDFLEFEAHYDFSNLQINDMKLSKYKQ